MVTSRFLPPLSGGIISGEIDISHISQADWRTIGGYWAEQASQRALMNADKPTLELVQACQILALYWFAKGETIRTNMHTSIAYRASRLLHLHQMLGKNSDAYWSAGRDRGLRCFWACWLTKCASQENANFQIDCWDDVIDCPLPDDDANGSLTIPTRCLGKHGLIQDVGPTLHNSPLGFNASLIIIQGLWWEVQRFVQAVHATSSSPTERAFEFCSLSKRLEELPDKMDEFAKYKVDREPPRSNSGDQGRVFSLTYLYHLCVVYLHSSMVPVLSCSSQTPPISRAMIRLAAEQAWEHSVFITTITEQFIARKASISKSWAVVGYGAYVCAAIQLRRYLALGILTHQRLKDTTVHLHLAGELRKYWMTLRPLHNDMERQFSQAEALISSQPVNRRQETDEQRGQLTRLIVQPDSGSSPELSSHLRPYAASDDIQKEQQPVQPNSNVPVIAVEARDTSPGTSPGSNVPQRPHDTPPAQTLGHAERPLVGWEPPLEGLREECVPAPNWTFREDGIWWSQDPESLGDVFGSGFFLHDDIDLRMDMH
ncbi:hypothetical protein B0T10DRAFT_579059 [Thelonectria olida]|uniref:Xylanolytic transcriptional activator regulatory domain-containing protein n=1 Tax=Thelonectria olida TaxID=1576542 RepID=A0A9P9APD9_9HYPO|nr:hypothetical protein B0T10DRAFT_579059 [Thelonectria olida]